MTSQNVISAVFSQSISENLTRSRWIFFPICIKFRGVAGFHCYITETLRWNKQRFGLFEWLVSFPVTKKGKKYERSCQISGLTKLTLQLSRVGMTLIFTGREVTGVRNSLVRQFQSEQ